MKSIFTTLTLLGILFFSSCEKENSLENGGFPGTPVGGGGGGSSNGSAVFEFSDAAGTCTGAVITGTYTAGTLLTATNTAVLSVDVDSVGTYSVTTNTLNGISFSASGTFSSTGVQTITFTGSGTPATAGSYNFITGTDGCTFTVTVLEDSTPPPAEDCKECIYTPFCEGSWFKFKTNFSGVEGSITNRNLTSTDTTINGVAHAKMNSTSDNGTNVISNSTYFNCTNGVSTVFAYTLTGLAGSTVTFIRSTPIKANEPVGATWSEVIQNQAGQDITNQYTIIEKGISRTVLGRTYTDVIHIELTQSIDVLGNTVSAGTSQYYYARGVGVIETTNEVFGSTSSQLLEDYFIP